MNPLTVQRRIEDWSIPEPNSGCWIWLKSTNAKGYAHLRHEGIMWRANRLAWVAYRGQIPEGLFVLHHCDNPACVNPDHLYVGTHAKNMEDKAKRNRSRNGRSERTECPRGHLYTEENTYYNKNGWRSCLACRHIVTSTLNAKRKQQHNGH